MQIALFQPDIPQNTGTILRTCAWLDVGAHIIEPAGTLPGCVHAICASSGLRRSSMRSFMSPSPKDLARRRHCR
jgi:hypothetical protein